MSSMPRVYSAAHVVAYDYRRSVGPVLKPETEAQNQQTQVLISSGTVVDNLSVPPSGGCVVSVKYKMDGDRKVLTYPGFHQHFFYGDHKRELENFCQLYKFRPRVI